ncbi:unnamed protein product [Rhizopus stolonifer]
MEAFVTLVATNSYAPGALVIAHRLRDLGSKRDSVCLVTQNLSPQVQAILSKVYITIPVDTICSQDRENLELLGRPDLDITFTKIHAWRLTQYHKIVFLDADVFPLQNIDALFQRPSFSAASDAGWPDCFNSGVFVTEPSEAVYDDLVELASEQGSFDGGDQGLLNTYFSSWPDSPSHRLPFTFNTTPTAQYGYAPAQVQYGHKVNIVHFIGQNKPWKYQRFTDGKVLPMGDAWEGTCSMVEAWWNTWDKYYGRISPYHLLSGHLGHFDSGFQTRPIVPFSETVRNAWDDEKIEVDRRSVNPMPPISTITMTQPDWLQKELKQIAEHNYENHENHQDHRQRPHQNDSQEPYSMIQWDPAYEDPPNTGSLGADIPDLSSYKNVWDQSLHDQQQHIWVAPVFRPEPEIMKKPEYAHFKQEEVIDNQEKNEKREKEKHHQENRSQVEYTQEEQYQEEHRSQEEYHKEEHYQDEQYYQEEHYHQEEHSQEKRNSEEEHHQEGYHQEGYHQEEYHQEEHHQEEHHQEEYHQEEHRQEEHHQEEHHQEEYHQEEHRQEEHHQEEHHQEEHHQEVHNEKEINEDRDVSIQIQEEIQVVYPDAFPWESNPDHFPAPTRVWQDEIYHHSVIVEEVREEPETNYYVEETQVTPHEEYHEHIEAVEKSTYEYIDQQEQKNEQDIVTIRHEVQEIINEQTQSDSKNDEERFETTEQPQEPITETHTQVIEEREKIKLQEVSTVTTEHNTALFAIDEPLTPSVQTRIGEFIANLQEEEDNDISDRDLIPINFKPSSRLQSGVYTPSPLVSRSVSRAESRAGSRTGSRRSSVVSSRRNSLPGNQKRPTVDLSVIQPKLIEQSSKLYASEPTFSGKTPYTSAAATPATAISPEIEAAEYFNEPDQDDFYQSSTYCLNDSLDLVHQTKSPETWNPLDALTRLKSQSESMVLKQSLTEALNRAAKEQEELDNLEPLEPPKSIFRSVWNKEEDDLPNILSGYSSPRTPVMRGMSSNLSLEIEQEKERHRQRESLMMTEPHNAVATLLEAELDLSSGSLFKRRHQGIPKTPETPKIIQQEIKQEEMTGFEAAYFSEDVIKEAQRRLNSLKNEQEITISHDPLPLPSETFVSKPVSRPSHMYQSTLTQSFDSKNYLPNFGFNEQHKLKIYQSDLIEPEVLATVIDALEIKENPLFKETIESSVDIKAERNEEELVVVAEESLTETRTALEEDWVDVSNEEIKTKEGLLTISDEDSITIQKPSSSVDKLPEVISAVGELVVTGVQDLGDLKEKTVEQTKEDAQISIETEVASLAIRKDIESAADTQAKEEIKESVVVEEEQTRRIQEEILVEVEEQTREIQEELSVELEEQTTIEKIQELSIELEEKQIIKEIEDLSVEIEQEQTTREIQKLELEEKKVTREVQEIELEETSVEIEEINDSDYTNVGHYGVEVFEVDSDTQEFVLKSKGIVEAVEDEVLEIDEGSLEIDEDYLEIEMLDEDRHPEMIEIDEDSLEIELVDEEFEVETMEFEEETPDEFVVQESEELVEVSKENTEDQEVKVEVIVHETEPEIVEIKRQPLDFETEEQEVYVNVVTQENETEIIEIKEEGLNIITDSQEVDVEVVEIDTGASKYKYTGLETIPEAEVSESNETTVYESKDTGLASISETIVSESKDTWLESISETTISEFKDLGYFTDRRITTLEPIQIIYEYSEAETTDTEAKTLRVETVSREVKSEAIEIKGSSEKMTGSTELVGSPSSYFTSKSMLSSTESIQSRPSLPTRKLSIAESLLSSRYSSASILTTPVIGAFEKHTDGSSSKSDIMTRVRSYASSKAPSVASVDTTSISSSTRPSNTDPKHTSFP